MLNRTEFYVKNSNQKKLRNYKQIHRIIREITGEEEKISHPLCIYNDKTSFLSV